MRNAKMKDTDMSEPAEIQCCSRDTEIDRLVCRMAAHDSYGASPAAGDCDDRPTDDGDRR